MAELNLKAQISSLSKLQTIDTEIYDLKHQKAAKPEAVKLLETVFEEKKINLANAEKVLLDLQRKKKDNDVELASKEEAAKKLQIQLYQLKTNKEYQTMLQQIADTKADASVVEDKIIELLEQIDKSKSKIDLEKQKLQQEDKVFNEERKKINDCVREIDDRLSQLEVQRKQAIADIDAKILGQYERILSNRDGLAIVTVKDNSCQGCNMFVPPQVINLIKMYERIVTCEVCNRILYIGDESR